MIVNADGVELYADIQGEGRYGDELYDLLRSAGANKPEPARSASHVTVTHRCQLSRSGSRRQRLSLRFTPNGLVVTASGDLAAVYRFPRNSRGQIRAAADGRAAGAPVACRLWNTPDWAAAACRCPGCAWAR